MADSTALSQGVDDALVPPTADLGDDSAKMLQKIDDLGKVMAADKIGFVYERWRNHRACTKRWPEAVWGQGRQEKTEPGGGLYMLKIINWGYLEDTRARLDNLSKAGGELDGATKAILGNVRNGWQSKAGEAAAGKIDELSKAAFDYQNQIGQLRDSVAGARKATREAVEKLAGFLDSPTGGQAFMQRHRGLGDDEGVDHRAELSTYMDEMERALNFGIWKDDRDVLEADDDFDEDCEVCTVDTLHRAGGVWLEDGNNTWADVVIRELDSICDAYNETIGNFRKQVNATIEAVQEAWDRLQVDASSLAATPFDKLVPGPTEKPQEPKPKDPPKQEPKDPGGSGNPKDPGGSGNAKPPGGSGNPPTPKLPEMPKPELPEMPEKPEAPEQPGMGATDPSGAQRPNETVTIKDGDHTIEVSSPDSKGGVKVTVDDGSGTPKTYDIDFGAGGPSSGTPTPGGPVQAMPYPADGVQRPGDFGPGGAGGQVPGQPVVPGPDGVARIQDGDLSITAHRPDGAPDTVVVTVDNGDGSPQTYTLDYAEGSAQGQPNGSSGTGYSAASASPLTAQAERVGGAPQQEWVSRPAEQVWTAPGEAQTFAAQGESVPSGASAATGPDMTTTPSGVDSWGDVLSDVLGTHTPGGDLGEQISESTAPSEASAAAKMGAAQVDAASGASGAMGGGMPMGGMGGGAGGNSGDTERSASAWRTTGSLFDDDSPADRIGGALGFDRR